ncbi:hypothetical protein QTP88_017711 [Uroleucon formosanum]
MYDMLVVAVTLVRVLRSGRCFIFFRNSLIPDSCSILLSIMRRVVNRNVIKLNVKHAQIAPVYQEMRSRRRRAENCCDSLLTRVATGGAVSCVRRAPTVGQLFTADRAFNIWCRLLMVRPSRASRVRFRCVGDTSVRRGRGIAAAWFCCMVVPAAVGETSRNPSLSPRHHLSVPAS